MDVQDVWNWVIDEDSFNIFFNNSPRFVPMSNDSSKVDLLHTSLVKKFFEYLKNRNNVIIVSKPIFTLEATDNSKPMAFDTSIVSKEYPVSSFSTKNFADTSDEFLEYLDTYFKTQCVAVYGVTTVLKIDVMSKMICYNIRCRKLPNNMMVVQEITSRMVERKINKLFK